MNYILQNVDKVSNLQDWTLQCLVLKNIKRHKPQSHYSCWWNVSFARLEVLLGVPVNIIILWDMQACQSRKIYMHFRRICCLLPQDRILILWQWRQVVPPKCQRLFTKLLGTTPTWQWPSVLKKLPWQKMLTALMLMAVFCHLWWSVSTPLMSCTFED